MDLVEFFPDCGCQFPVTNPVDEDNPLALVPEVLPENLAEIIHLEIQRRPFRNPFTAGNPFDMQVDGQFRQRIRGMMRSVDGLEEFAGNCRTQFPVFFGIDRDELAAHRPDDQPVHLQLIEVLPETDEGRRVIGIHHTDFLPFDEAFNPGLFFFLAPGLDRPRTGFIAGRFRFRLRCEVLLDDAEVFEIAEFHRSVLSCVSQLLAGRPEDHEDHGSDTDGNPDPHLQGQGLAEQEGSDQDGRQRFEDAEDGRFRRADVTGRDGQREHGDHRRDDRKSDEIAPVSGGIDAFDEAPALKGPDDGKQNGTGHQRVQGQRMLGDIPDAFAPVDDDQIERITEGGQDGQDDAGDPDGRAGRRGGQQQDAAERGDDGHPGLPTGIEPQEYHDQRDEDGIQIDQRRRQAGRDEFIGGEQEQAAAGEQGSQHGQEPQFLSIDFERFPLQEHPTGEDHGGDAIAEKEHDEDGNTALEKGFCKQRVCTVGYAGDKACSQSDGPATGRIEGVHTKKLQAVLSFRRTSPT